MSFDIAVKKMLGECVINVRIEADAQLIALVGPSGAGKTTLLNCIAGLANPNSGHIRIAGETLFDSEDKTNLSPEQRGCGYVFQEARLFPHLSVRGNLLYGQGRAAANPVTDFDDIVALLDIGPLLGRMPANLSGGEIRRVAIGRALLSGPRFLLLDEPLASLDPQRAEQVLSAIEDLRDELSIPIIHVSHDSGEVARLTDCVVRLD